MMEAAVTLPAGPSAGLFAELGGAMFLRALRILGDEAAAVRCAETLFVRFVVYAEAPALNERTRWNWIYRVGTSYALRQVSGDVQPGGGGEAAPWGQGRTRGGVSLPDIKALRRMDEATQSILVLWVLERLSANEIAEVLGLSEKLVRQRLDAAASAPGSSVIPDGGAAGDAAHPSSLALNRDRTDHVAHIEGCAQCRAEIDETERLAARFAREVAP
ncbi:MAG: sigma-70 family RNA polymerase sigma factor, partial [Deltaproteobacteria bacterium]|nr:sigma-70 family RNA polymerase sigma factor [Deltaproteobacteria bacterium]